jgi:hypothetical protein
MTLVRISDALTVLTEGHEKKRRFDAVLRTNRPLLGYR